MTVDTDRPMLTIEEAAALARVSRRTIYAWLAAGKLQTCRTVGGRVRIYADSLWRTPTEEDG